MVKIGSFVSAKSIQDGTIRQGVVVKDQGDETVVIKVAGGEKFVCLTEWMEVIPRERLSASMARFVEEVREWLAWGEVSMWTEEV